ncbi:hypothetical protein GLOTRDRAFT_130951 [Gloeophyllum trabeum ATCC 11539]|uniref:F-box domain-containing protein n=1 Tax=Gloeophyllum trabeum (strain ATCC 11539 / FP-39264 / Madison 617) TaxID=670483 RepID=S7Q0Y7_GLOTA|nr:uncharacterized protein GLOTRDRAFT_130951 [Gloeophyllum trabeum ATCC 11539]EPQ53606.1 hypothetical protein GLOTRDRAFT_130951 [Gloeophyllum trabeum ATCC 11539]
MHRALVIHDILNQVLGYLQVQKRWTDTIDTRRERHDLICIALTCKAFLDPALDELWARLDSLNPLLRLLSGFQWTGDVYILAGGVSPGELARFSRYAARVRELEYRRDAYIHPSVVHRLVVARSAPLLPGLRVLQWDEADPSCAEVMFLITPTLMRVEIQLAHSKPGYERDERPLEAFVNALADTVPMLRHLVFTGTLRHNHLARLSDLKFLQSVTLKGRAPFKGPGNAFSPEGPVVLTTPQMYYDFSLMQHLAELDIDVDGLQPLYPPSYYHFLQLRSLRLTGTLAYILPLLDTISTGLLTSLSLSFASPHSSTCCDLRALFSKAPLYSARLRHLRIHASAPARWQPPEALSFQDVFAHFLTPDSTMEEVDIHLENAMIAMTDAHIVQLADSLPLLRTFSCRYAMADGGVSPTLWCLIPFVYRCPSLTSLALPVRMLIPPEDTWQFLPQRGIQMRTLDLLEWPEGHGQMGFDVREVARMLDVLFPNLDLNTIERESWRSTMWREVFAAIGVATARGSMQAIPNHALQTVEDDIAHVATSGPASDLVRQTAYLAQEGSL